jgi:hypothetical protein
MLGSIVLISRRSDSQIHPNFSSLSASSKYMKSPNWFTQNRLLSHLRIATAGALIAAAVVSAIASFQPDPPNTRLTNDNGANGGYVSAYTLATGNPYTDATLDECSISRGRQNEPAIAVDPRNTSVLLGSSNDYCGVYNRGIAAGAVGPIWLGYYRSENGGASFISSLVPGYPDDTSPYAALAHIRTASAGDPVITWDNHGRAFFGSESSEDPAGTPKTFGDQWVAVFDNPGGENGNTINDGKRFVRTEIVARGSSAPNLLGKFNDKTAIEADRTGGACDGNVYYAWSRFTGNVGQSNIYFVRSTDHGATWSSPMLLTPSTRNVQDPDISVTANGHVYVTYDQGSGQNGQPAGNAIVKSTDCGQTFSKPKVLATFIEWEQRDVSDPEPVPVLSSPDDPGFGKEAQGVATSRDCGDFADHCKAGYTFFRLDTTTRSAADQLDQQHEWIYLVYNATKPGTVVDSGTTYGSAGIGKGSQAGVFFVRYDGANGQTTTPKLIDNRATGHQGYPDIAADGGMLHALWWDTRNDPCYSAARPVGNCADRSTVPALDVYATSSNDHGVSWAASTKVTDVMSNGNYEQFDNRSVPFGGDYLWITARGSFAYGTWTDWRNTVQGSDPREVTEDEDNATADVKQCRTFNATTGTWSGDQCPHAGGIDQDIYGAVMP